METSPKADRRNTRVLNDEIINSQEFSYGFCDLKPQTFKSISPNYRYDVFEKTPNKTMKYNLINGRDNLTHEDAYTEDETDNFFHRHYNSCKSNPEYSSDCEDSSVLEYPEKYFINKFNQIYQNSEKFNSNEEERHFNGITTPRAKPQSPINLQHQPFCLEADANGLTSVEPGLVSSLKQIFEGNNTKNVSLEKNQVKHINRIDFSKNLERSLEKNKPKAIVKPITKDSTSTIDKHFPSKLQAFKSNPFSFEASLIPVATLPSTDYTPIAVTALKATTATTPVTTTSDMIVKAASPQQGYPSNTPYTPRSSKIFKRRNKLVSKAAEIGDAVFRVISKIL